MTTKRQISNHKTAVLSSGGLDTVFTFSLACSYDRLVWSHSMPGPRFKQLSHPAHIVSSLKIHGLAQRGRASQRRKVKGLILGRWHSLFIPKLPNIVVAISMSCSARQQRPVGCLALLMRVHAPGGILSVGMILI